MIKKETEVLDYIHPQVEPIITEANRIFIEGFQKGGKVSWKKSTQLSTSALTETDLKLDHFLRKQLSKTFPNIGFITEEQEDAIEPEGNWVIDPLDGTANFANKIPITGISLALWRKYKPIYGLLSFPLENETIYAASGKGAFKNGELISHPNEIFSLFPSILFTGLGTDIEKAMIINNITKVVPFPENYRSASFHLKTIALHRADCGIFVNMPIWDIAAGLLIIKEAGLSCTFLTEPPKGLNMQTRNNRYTFVAGDKNIVSDVAKQMKTQLEYQSIL